MMDIGAHSSALHDGPAELHKKSVSGFLKEKSRVASLSTIKGSS